MWNKSKSILLSKICVFIFAATGAAICIGLPWLAKFLINYSGAELQGKYALILISGYVLAVPAFMVLFEVYRLLKNISADLVFTHENTKSLRRISWLCIFAGIACLLCAVIYYPSAFIIGSMASFTGLIIRVLKNVFAEAVRIKEENDFTI